MSPAPKETFKNSWIPPTVKIPKGKIIEIDFGEHEQEVKRIWEGKPPASLIEIWKESGLKGEHPEKYYSPPSMQSRFNSAKRLMGYSNLVGYCSCCKSLNTHILKQKIDGAIILTRYCSEHVPDKI